MPLCSRCNHGHQIAKRPAARGSRIIVEAVPHRRGAFCPKLPRLLQFLCLLGLEPDLHQYPALAHCPSKPDVMFQYVSLS